MQATWLRRGTRLATAPGLVRPGAAHWDGDRTPIHPLSMESAYADPALLRDLGIRGARFGRQKAASTIAIGYSASESNTAGATMALKTPPSAPPSDIRR